MTSTSRHGCAAVSTGNYRTAAVHVESKRGKVARTRYDSSFVKKGGKEGRRKGDFMLYVALIWSSSRGAKTGGRRSGERSGAERSGAERRLQ